MRLAIAMLLAVALAGCAEPAATEADDDLPEAEATATTGAISGVVVDAMIMPIPDATITLSALDLSVTSDEDGGFVIEDLEPGVYFIDAIAPGYFATQTSATIVAGEVSKARIQLTIDETPVPTPVTQKFEGRVELADAWVTWIAGEFTGNTELCKCWFYAEVGENAHTAILEMFWTPSNPANDPGFWLDHYSPDGDRDSGSIENPGRLQYDAQAWSSGESSFQISVGTTVQFQQDVEIFYTVWYDGAPPDGWSIQDA